MRKKIKNEIKEMVANVDWANVAPDNDNNNTMAYLFPTEVPSNRVGVAKAVLTCRPDSHPFPERTLLLHQPVKVGRAVAKIKAAPDNAIFDCKVLSRHHASLWYNNGHFYLQDTKSSNGTFVNNHRLSEGCKESAPYEVCSGDIVQFGVDVLENSCSVTHGCIVATLRLYLPDGKEAKASQSTIVKSPTHVEDLCILNNIIQEAVQREQLLEAKLRSLHMVVENCAEALGQAWHALCSEERLIARVHFLERRLAVTQQQQPATELQQMIDDKHQYEVNAMEALRVAHEEKLKLLNQLGTIQWSVCSSEEECAVLRGHVDRAHKDLQDLGEKKSTVEKELQESKEALQEAKRQITQYEVILLSDLIEYKEENHSTENGYGEDVVEKKLGPENSDNIALIWEKLGKANQRESSLSEAIKGLPEHIKAGYKFKIPNHVKELEVKLYSLKNELWKLENNRSDDEANDNPARGEPHTVIDTDTEENKTNSDYNSSENSDSSKLSIIVDEEQNRQDMTPQENKEVDNQNDTVLENSNIFDKLGAESTKEMKTKLLRDKINEITEQLDTAYENGLALKLVLLQKELSFAEGHIASLTKDLETTTSKLKQSACEVAQLNQIKGQLSSEVLEVKSNFSKKVEECSKLEMMLSQSPIDEREKTDEDETSKYKEEVTQLQNRLEDLLKSEANSSEEIERLNCRISDLQKELQERSLSSNVEHLTEQVENLKKQLEAKEKEVVDLNKQVTLLIDIQVRLEEKVNVITSDLSVVAREKELRDVADKIIMTDLDDSECKLETQKEKRKSSIVISSSLAAADYLYNNESSLLSMEDPSISNISVDTERLTELEEELVVTKEKYDLVSEDNVQLTARLQTLENNHSVRRSAVDMLVYVLPVAAMLIYILMYQYIS